MWDFASETTCWCAGSCWLQRPGEGQLCAAVNGAAVQEPKQEIHFTAVPVFQLSLCCSRRHISILLSGGRTYGHPVLKLPC